MTLAIYRSSVAVSCQPKARSFLGTLGQRFTIARQRRQLLALDGHRLNDLGLSRVDAEAEGRQGIWNAPVHWRN